MSALGAAPARQPTWPARLSRPRIMLAPLAVVVAAWVALIVLGGHGHAHAQEHQTQHHIHEMAPTAPTGSGGESTAFAAALPLWALMTIAMMGPAALPALRHVCLNSLRWRRGRALATFAAVYLALWIGFGAIVVLARPLWDGIDPALTLAVGLAIATAWQLTARKRRALNDCHRTSPLPPRGRRATGGVVRFGLLNGGACVRSCWPLMLVMALAPSAELLWMAGLSAIVTVEKLTERPRRAARDAAVLLGAAALGAVAVALAAIG